MSDMQDDDQTHQILLPPKKEDSQMEFPQNNSSHQREPAQRRVSGRLKEANVGITEYIGAQGFVGVIKERYSDFHVNEISEDGKVAKLTHQEIPKIPEDDVDFGELAKAVPVAIREKILALKEKDHNSAEIDVTEMGKEERRKIHAFAKKTAELLSQTVERDGRKIVVILRRGEGQSDGEKRRKDDRVSWKSRGGDYCHFLLHKVNIDTMDALNQIALNLRLRPNNLSYAGTKDRRAWTTQWVALRKVNPSEILRSAKRIRGAFVGNFQFRTEPLKLGKLAGNRFRIALRNISAADELIENVMTSLEKEGFLNYYGLQRFGSVESIPTYEIGRALLRGKWSEAIDLILKPRDGERDRDLAAARRLFQSTRNAAEAYKLVRRRDKVEARLLKGISSAGEKNPQGALDSIPRNTRLMYIHAYQSLLWNRVVSRRIKEFGRKPIEGDLVLENGAAEPEIRVDDPESDGEPEKKMAKLNHEGETTERPGENEDKFDNNKSDHFPGIKVLKLEDLPEYSLADVIMPQVGWKVTFPAYAKPWIAELLANDEVNCDFRQKNRKYSLGGAYRKILQIPSHLSWKIVHYKEIHSDLIMSDIDEMRKMTPPQNESDGQYKALIVEMSLKPSTYATMALREIVKNDTSPEVQAAQSAKLNAERIIIANAIPLEKKRAILDSENSQN